MSLTQNAVPLPYHAYILAAGTSRRFGSNKAFAHWQGTSFLSYQLQLLASYFVSVQVVAPTFDAYCSLGVEHALVDRFPAQGPLAGLDAALQDLQGGANDDWLFLASCDTFGVQAQDILTLAKALPQATGKYQAVLWRDHNRLEPLWGFYAVSLAANVYQRLCEGCLPLHKLLEDIEVKCYDRSFSWTQVNAPADFPENP